MTRWVIWPLNYLIAQIHVIAAGSQEIAAIITLIESVAFQTNILALNAAIEAAHAGQHGRGFSVVAREVGIFAHQSGHSALNIKRLNISAKPVGGAFLFTCHSTPPSTH